jgi:hypothetical protein
VQSEAFSRTIIDRFYFSMFSVFKILNLAMYKADEFRIATLENPVEIIRGRFKTILTGHTDFAYFLQCKSPGYNYIEILDC